MADRAVMYLGVARDTRDWIEAQKAQSGLAYGKIVDVVVAEAARLGWKITGPQASRCVVCGDPGPALCMDHDG